MFGILEAVAAPQEGIYATYDDLIKDLNNRVTKEGYKIVKSRSHKGRLMTSDDPDAVGMVRCDLVCDRGGRPYKSTATKHKSTTKKTNCPWNAKAVHRRQFGGWVLTIKCDQHNHEPGTPEPPTPSATSEVGDNDAEGEDDGPQPDPDTSEALQIAGVSNSSLRLTGDTFQLFKTEYRKMSPPERLGILSQLQLRVAAIYAIQNEDIQRQKRQDAQHRRHMEIEAGRGQRQIQKQRARRPRQQQPPQPQQVQQAQQTQQAQQGALQSQQQVQTQQPLQHLQHQQTLPPQQTHQLPSQQQHMGQFQMSPDSPSQQLMSLGLAQIQQYAGPPTDKRMRGAAMQQGQQPTA
ncbi:unnamed protein product [Clonostachys solani]|uniref:FAR1 domain-containing protein n=1 Tax=Clonostachys solani TaxID=160281 RepID=A0A9N9Z852_9HYPO|nr:unnamed protein product [Clonostachys solani]